jgi:sterol desaturase/sphingolipid hydroxylase (fatty acid hydroxylase superfamily)
VNAHEIVLIAIPYFVLLTATELWLDYRNGWKHYKSLRDTLSNLYIGVGEVALSLVIKGTMIYVYDLVLRYWAPFKIPDTWWSALLFFVLFDFIYYWAHRLGHEVNFMWAGHVPHHSSEAFNLTVALRQPWFQVLTTWFLFVPLALMGFSTQMLIVVSALDILYQFWIHTPYIRKMPRWFEFIFNTPSHHRVHHGKQEKYLDKNHGGVLIIWDRIFGTFQEEEETPEYGITQPLHSFNPLWANVHHFSAMANTVLNKPKVWSKALLASPRLFGKLLSQKSEEGRSEYEKKLSPNTSMFLIWHFVSGILQTLWLLSEAQNLPFVTLGLFLFSLIWHITNAGLMLDGKPIVTKLEALRLLIIITFSGLMLTHHFPLNPNLFVPAMCLFIYALVSAIWMFGKAPLKF